MRGYGLSVKEKEPLNANLLKVMMTICHKLYPPSIPPMGMNIELYSIGRLAAWLLQLSEG